METVPVLMKHRVRVRSNPSPRVRALLLHVAACPILSYVPVSDVKVAGDGATTLFHLSCGHSVEGTIHMLRWGTFAPCTECCPGGET